MSFNIGRIGVQVSVIDWMKKQLSLFVAIPVWENGLLSISFHVNRRGDEYLAVNIELGEGIPF